MNRKSAPHAYPAVFSYAEDGISISFPDLPGCYSCGWTDEEALRMAKDALSGFLWCMKNDGDELPTPSNISDIDIEEGQKVILVEA